MKYKTLQDLLFLLPTETSHHLSLESIGLMQQLKLTPLIAREMVSDPVEVMGIKFPNRVGLAAGLDKDARCIEGLASLGFGFLEVGSVTPRPQPGNPKPRLFRLKSRKALINRMGFNNEGVDAMMKRIRRSKFSGVLGINIGKNADTPLESTLDDYIICLRKVYKQASYVVLNISSPNTQGLRSLQHGEELSRLLEGLKKVHQELKLKYARNVPLLVKIAPDMDDDEIHQVIHHLLEFELDGVIVSNTTVSRSAVVGEKYSDETGGLSGDPLRNQSNHVLGLVAADVNKKMAVIGVGGIMSGDDAAEKIRLGADLVQIYTGFIYAGPDLITESALAIKHR
ncbi:MAG: quinone-dependent dihydroorotate dehydrogenase [bacterium]|nr:quinone-dependent dihydroorotate dehydrogenase [Gammaproteobacteria bacterium]HIL99119.1 quinone-dependent dihydroorotate dehydrogenase [Pseudomonadales bacterium]